MSETPHFWPNLTGKIHADADLAIKMLFNAVQQGDRATVALKEQLTTAVAAQTTINVTTAATTGTTTTTTFGGVNNQTGTAYTVQDTDYGGIVTMSNAAPFALTLSASVRQFWFGSLENLGAGIVTLTPAGGATVNGVASIQLVTNMGALAFFDGVNWWALTSPTPTTIAFKVNGTPNSSQTLLNLIAGTNVTLTDGGGGAITVAATAGIISRIPHDVTATRVFATTYQNTTGQEMYISGWGTNVLGGLTGSIAAAVGTVSPTISVYKNQTTATVAGGSVGFALVVPSSYFYSVTVTGDVSGTPGGWVEYF